MERHNEASVRWLPCGAVFDSGDAAWLAVIPARQTAGAMYMVAAALCDAGLPNQHLRLQLHEPPESKVGFAVVLNPSLCCSVDEAVAEWPRLIRRVRRALARKELQFRNVQRETLVGATKRAK
jgi:hypothetical protein